MNDSLFKQFVHRVPANGETKDTDSDVEAADDYGAFAFMRGVRDRALMLELRLKDGSVTALGYGWLERAEFDPSNGLTLYFGSHKVTVIGRKLESEVRPNVRLLDGIIRHRVPWIREAGEPEVLRSTTDSLVIEEIRIE